MDARTHEDRSRVLHNFLRTRSGRYTIVDPPGSFPDVGATVTAGATVRTAPRRGLLFYRLLQQAVATDPHPYRNSATARRSPTTSPTAPARPGTDSTC